MKRINNNSQCNIHFPQEYRQQQNDQTALIIGLGFMCVMLFGLVVALLVALRIG